MLNTARFPRLRVLGPTVWTCAAATTIYLGCAAYEVNQDVRSIKQHWRRRGRSAPVTFEEVEKARRSVALDQEAASAFGSVMGPGLLDWIDPDGPAETWAGFSPVSKAIAAAVGLNVGLFGLRYYVSLAPLRLVHIPAGPRNYTLLTSAFLHNGPFYLGINMAVLIACALPLSHTPTFERSASHLSAFYLASAATATLVHHLTCPLTSSTLKMLPVTGASGAISAMIGALAMSHPDAEWSLLFIPSTFRAQDLLAGMIAFELAGTLGLFNLLGTATAHGAHLGGLLAGAAYISLGGKEKLWTPARRVAFWHMKKLRLV